MELTAEKREKTGKQNKSLRKTGFLPAVVFGPDFESINVSVNRNSFKKVFDKTGETSLIDLNLGKNSYKVLVKDMQFNPVSLDFLHIGFYKPNLKEKINADIPVEVVGEEKNPLVKSGEALVLNLMDTIKIEALPTDLPSAFIVDVSALDTIGHGISISELNYDKEKVEIIDLEPDTLVVKLDHAEMQEEPETETVSEEEALEGIEATEESAEEEEEEKK